jgi:hypothetical protein
MQHLKKIIISVKVAEVFDVQESDKAEFELILENNEQRKVLMPTIF